MGGKNQLKGQLAIEIKAELCLVLGTLESGGDREGKGLEGLPSRDPEVSQETGTWEGGRGCCSKVGMAILVEWEHRWPSSNVTLEQNWQEQWVCYLVWSFSNWRNDKEKEKAGRKRSDALEA